MPTPQSPSATVNGWAVAAIRVLTGTTRAELSKAIGLHVSTLSRLERGEYDAKLRPDTLARLTRWVVSHGVDRRAVLATPNAARDADENAA